MIVLVDFIGAAIVLVFALADFLRGAIRVLAGILAIIAGALGAYYYYEPAGQLIASQSGIDQRISLALGVLAVYLVIYIVGSIVFRLFLKILRNKWKKLDEIDLPGGEEAPQKGSEASPKGKKEEKKDSQPPSKDPSSDKGGAGKEAEEAAEEIQLTIMERLLGGALGAVKGVLAISLLFFLFHALPTPDAIRDPLDSSFFGKVYNYYIAQPLERSYPKFKMANNMGYLVEIGNKAKDNPQIVEKLKSHEEVEELLHLKPVQKMLKDKEFVEWAKENPVKALKDEKVEKLLKNPDVKKKLSEMNIRKIRDFVRGL